MEAITTSQAARQLGVSPTAVRKMLGTGRLVSAGRVGNALLIDPASLQRVLLGGKHTGRLWTPKTAWAALCLLSGQEAPWLEASEKYRLKKRLGTLSAEDVHLLARNRAKVTRYRATDSAAARALEELVPTAGSAMLDDNTAARFGLTGGGASAEGYAMAGDAGEIATLLAMVPDPAGNVVIRETTLAEPFDDGSTPLAAVAIDLMDSLATRERSAGIRLLEELLRG